MESEVLYKRKNDAQSGHTHPISAPSSLVRRPSVGPQIDKQIGVPL
jgi:hypothetical protein